MPTKPGIQRSQDFGPQEVRELVKRLRAVASTLNGVAKEMDKKGVESVRVEGSAMVERGFDSFGKFVGNCQKELQDF